MGERDRAGGPVVPPSTSVRDRLRPIVQLAATALPRGAVLLSILTFGGYAMGLVRDRMFARAFGAGPELDAYNAAFVLPELALDVLVAGGLVAPFVPVFTGLRVDAEEAAAAFGRSILTLAVLVMAVVSAALFVFAPQTVAVIAPGFGDSQRELYVGLFRIMCVTPVIFAASIVLGEILVAKQRFVTYGLAPLFYNGGIVAGTLLLGDRIGIYGAAYGAVAGAIGHLAIRLIGIARTDFRPRPTLVIRVRGVTDFLRLMVPKMASHPIEPLTFLYFTSLASRLDAGSISSVSYARNFESVPVSIIGASFAIAAFPALSAAVVAGDRREFRRIFGLNLATIAILTTGAGVGLFVFGGLAIRILLGGGAFDEADIARTSLILGLFAIAVPLESLTHLLSRGLYATRNTVLPTLASIAGFVVIVVSGEALVGPIGLAAVPVAFALGMGVKNVILAAALVPRIARIGSAAVPPLGPVPLQASVRNGGWRPRRSARALPTPWLSATEQRARSRLRPAAIVLALVVLAGATLYATSQALSGASFAYAPAVTPWARLSSPAIPGVSNVPASAGPSTALSPEPSAPPEPSRSAGLNGSPSPPPTQPPVATPTPGPFSMDLYQAGDYVGEFRDVWCLPAAMQTSMNIMDAGADRTQATQNRLFRLARSLDPAPDGAAEPEAWARGLAELGYGNYKVSVQPSIRAAIQLAAKQIRLTNRPAGVMVWRGAHSWVMSGFSATADPATTASFTVTAVRIEDVWYPRISTIWGASRPPDSLVAVGKLSEDYLPWKRPRGSYPDKDGRFVLVVPIR